jgi:hypothetical protein
VVEVLRLESQLMSATTPSVKETVVIAFCAKRDRG